MKILGEGFLFLALFLGLLLFVWLVLGAALMLVWNWAIVALFGVGVMTLAQGFTIVAIIHVAKLIFFGVESPK